MSRCLLGSEGGGEIKSHGRAVLRAGKRFVLFVSTGAGISSRNLCGAPVSRRFFRLAVGGPSLESLNLTLGPTAVRMGFNADARGLVFQVSRLTTSCPCTLGPAVAVGVPGLSAMVRLLVLPDCGTIWEGRGASGCYSSVYVAGGEGIRVSALGCVVDARPLDRVECFCARWDDAIAGWELYGG